MTLVDPVQNLNTNCPVKEASIDRGARAQADRSLQNLFQSKGLHEAQESDRKYMAQLSLLDLAQSTQLSWNLIIL